MLAFEKPECCVTVPFAWKIVYYTNDSVYFIRGGKIITWLKSLTRFFHVDVKTCIQIPTTAETFPSLLNKNITIPHSAPFPAETSLPVVEEKN